jgi:carboxylesterase type B
MILYVPQGLTQSSAVPTMMWIHGGSFVVGGATDPGLDGSALATATNAIVAVVQYRLGAVSAEPYFLGLATDSNLHSLAG